MNVWLHICHHQIIIKDKHETALCIYRASPENNQVLFPVNTAGGLFQSTLGKR